MSASLEALVAVAIGIGLAAATGFRVFAPFLIAGLAARWGLLPLSSGFEWLSSTGALVTLGTASVLEIAAYYVPGVDHVLDLLAGPAAVVAGIVASAAAMADIPPAILWPVAIIGGGGVAGLTKASSAVVRAKAGVTTMGLANPVVATGETAGAVTVALAAIVVPIVCLIVVAVLVLWLARRALRFMSRPTT
jgi:hypothetical protein